MASYRGPANNIHLAKLRHCEVHSMGFTTQPLQAPLSAHVTLINRKEDVGIEITFTPDEAFKLEQHLKDFRERREYYAAQQRQAAAQAAQQKLDV